jgi:hypothetical protein
VGVNKGFTTIEMLVIIGVLSLLSATLLTYSRTGERQIVLVQEQARIIGWLYRAKSFAVATFGKNEVPCGYGVHFEAPNTVIIFKEISPSSNPDCLDIDFVYSPSLGEKVEEFKINPNVKLVDSDVDGLKDILFIPPDPIVVLDNNLLKTEALIKIETVDGKGERLIKVNNGGQITSQ